jgi:hypothetical protein
MRIIKSGRPSAKRAVHRVVTTGMIALASAVAGLPVPGLQGQAHAQTIQNGSFSTTQGGAVASYFLTPGTSAVPGWTYGAGMGTAYGCMVQGNAFSPGCNALGSVTGPGFSPDGGNFLAIDVSSSNNAFISQVLAGLTLNASYTISFYQASINPDPFTDGVEWLVSLGGTLLNPTPTVMKPAANSDTPWTLETITFTATAAEIANPTLRFLANSTMAGGPPIALLDGVKLQVPEPASMALLGFGIAGLVGLRRRRARLAA